MPNCVVITGMHRSGTSLFANYLAQSGIEIGDNLLAPDQGNPKGYFEDKDIVELHNSILEANRCHYFFNLRKLPDFKIAENFHHRAEQIIHRKKADSNLWGWKDPRTSLFLDFWQKLLPENTQFIFLLRDPLFVYDSLIRRHTDEGISKEPVIGLKSWILYNRKLYSFYINHQDKAMIIDINRFVNNEEHYRQQLNHFIHIAITDKACGIIDQGSLKKSEDPFRTLKRKLRHPILWAKATRLYSKMLDNEVSET